MRKKRVTKRGTDLNRVWVSGTIRNMVGHLIRELRVQQRITQEQLSAQCQVRGLNLTRGTLAKIEARVRFIKACELYVIAKVLKVPMERFYPPNFGDQGAGRR